jgi:glycosyltransferase involved in cell wall biosynthesis
VRDGDAGHTVIGGSADPYVVAVGTLERRKNLPMLVQAFGRVARRVGGVRLVLAGAPGDDAVAVATAIDALPADVAARIVRPGRIDDAEKARLLAGAAALAYPSLDEGFGFPVLEAQQLGVPVLATTAGSVPEIAGDGATLVAPDDVDAWEHHLADLLTGTVDRDALVAAGRRNLDRFSWDRTAGGLVELYRTLVTGG